MKQLSFANHNSSSENSAMLNILIHVNYPLALFVVVLIVVGPTKAFSQMHEWVFPPGNPWFFYYQQSLMSTMMWAPVLFGWIAAQWAVFTLVFFACIQYLSSRFLRYINQSVTKAVD